ncbi:MAG: hypothetical protein ACRCTK_01545 [Alphaproteobacteria bacterium]
MKTLALSTGTGINSFSNAGVKDGGKLSILPKSSWNLLSIVGSIKEGKPVLITNPSGFPGKTYESHFFVTHADHDHKKNQVEPSGRVALNLAYLI